MTNFDGLTCQPALGLEAWKEYIIIYHGEDSPRKVIPVDETVNFSRMMYELNSSIVRSEPRWGQRATNALFDQRINGLFYMMPEQLSPDEIKDDWKIKLMNGNIRIMHDNDTNFVPIIAVHGEETPFSPF